MRDLKSQCLQHMEKDIIYSNKPEHSLWWELRIANANCPNLFNR